MFDCYYRCKYRDFPFYTSVNFSRYYKIPVKSARGQKYVN